MNGAAVIAVCVTASAIAGAVSVWWLLRRLTEATEIRMGKEQQDETIRLLQADVARKDKEYADLKRRYVELAAKAVLKLEDADLIEIAGGAPAAAGNVAALPDVVSGGPSGNGLLDPFANGEGSGPDR